jgi:hypothetical protein
VQASRKRRQKPRVSFSCNVSRHCAAELCTASRLPVDADAYSKTHLAAYANDLIAHLDLVIAYVELGRYQEARAEVSEVKRISPNFVLPPPQTSWFKDVALNQRWETELRKPGLK